MPAWVAAAVAVIFGAQSWWSSRRSKKAEKAVQDHAGRATAAAEKAALAQAQTAQATTRVTDVVERRATGADLKPWRIEKGGGGQWDFYLVNLTSTPNYGVTLAGEPVADADENTFDVIDGNSSVAIDVVTYAQMQDRAIDQLVPDRGAQRDSADTEDRIARVTLF